MQQPIYRISSNIFSSQNLTIFFALDWLNSLIYITLSTEINEWGTPKSSRGESPVLAFANVFTIVLDNGGVGCVKSKHWKT